MQPSTLQGILGHLRRLADPAHGSDLDDVDLLERFRQRREEAAFTLIVQRHGPMVLGVCRRLLGDAHEAEDAFQTVFLVLARNASAIRKQESLAGWLHRVASRIAHKMRAKWVQDRAREQKTAPPTADLDPFETLAARELRAALDEEIGRLPEKYRTPLVLCYLADKTHEQVAGELGWPKSSVAARLGRARELLQQRLVRRGFTVPVGLLAVLLTEQTANAMVPVLLTLSTVRSAVQSLRGEPIAGAATAALADSFVKGTAVLKLTAALTVLAALGFAAAIGYRLSAIGSPQQSTEPATKRQPAGRAHEPKGDGRKPRVDRQGDPLPDGVVARMGSGRMRHPGHVRAIAFSPDGKSIVSGGDKGLRIWDTTSGKLQQRADNLSRQFDVLRGWNLALAFRRDGIITADVGPEKRIVTVRFFDPTTGNIHRDVTMKEQAAIVYLALSADGGRIAFPLNNAVGLFDTSTGERTLRIDVRDGSVRGIAFAPDGKSLALLSQADMIRIHDAVSGKIVRALRHEGDTILRIFFSPDGRWLASTTWDAKHRTGEMSIWDIATGTERHRLKPPVHYVHCAAFSPDGKYVAAGGPFHDVLLWDLATGKEIRRFAGDGYSTDIAFAPDGKSLAAEAGESIRLWDVATGRVLPASADPFFGFVWGLRYDTEGQRLLGEGMKRWFVWDPATGRELQRLPKMPDDSWSLSPDESLLAGANRKDAVIHLRDARTGREVRELKGHTKPIWDVVFSPDGRRLISTSQDATIRIWDVATGQEVQKLDSAGNRLLAISPNGRRLASANNRNGPTGGYEVVLWDLKTGREMRRLPLTTLSLYTLQLRFSPDGRLLVTAGGGGMDDRPAEVKLWNVADGKLLRALEGHNQHVSSVAFSPDGRTLATGDLGGKLLLWELVSGRRRHAFVGHESGVGSLAFAPNGRTLAAASPESPVYIWDVLRIAEQPRRPLSDAELRRCWADLAGEDAAVAFQAIRQLIATSEQTLPFLREHLKPVAAPDLKRVRQLVETLDSDDFKARQQAAAELEKQADATASALRQMAKEKSSLYVRRTLQQILDGLETAPEALRAARAVEVLEWIATPESVRLLGELAKGATDARLTREAAAARERLTALLSRSPRPAPPR